MGKTKKVEPSKEKQEKYKKKLEDYDRMTEAEKSKDLRAHGEFRRTPSQVKLSENVDSTESNLKLAEKGHTVVLRVGQGKIAYLYQDPV